MAPLLTSVHCSSYYPLLRPSVRRITPSSPVSATTSPVLRRTRRQLQRCICSQYAGERPPPPDSPQQLERLFSNLNLATMKHEPGSVTSAIFLVAGTTVGAGILAIPAVTQEAGFLASAVICILCWLYMVVTGLLIAEVNVNTMCELGSGGVSLVSMAMRTLGTFGVRTACLSYLFIHYALLVAYVARSSDIITNSLGIPLSMGECYPVFSGFRRDLLLWKPATDWCSKWISGMSAS